VKGGDERMQQQMSRYDQWLTTQPEAPDVPLPGDEFYPRCSGCGAFLKRDEYEAGSGERTVPCSGELNPEYGITPCDQDKAHGPHDAVVAAWGTERRTCARCSKTDERITL
jgi:hypothetical protein